MYEFLGVLLHDCLLLEMSAADEERTNWLLPPGSQGRCIGPSLTPKAPLLAGLLARTCLIQPWMCSCNWVGCTTWADGSEASVIFTRQVPWKMFEYLWLRVFACGGVSLFQCAWLRAHIICKQMTNTCNWTDFKCRRKWYRIGLRDVKKRFLCLDVYRNSKISIQLDVYGMMLKEQQEFRSTIIQIYTIEKCSSSRMFWDFKATYQHFVEYMPRRIETIRKKVVQRMRQLAKKRDLSYYRFINRKFN